MTPTRPLPAAASGFNFGISVKFTLNDLTLRSAGTVAADDFPVVVVVAALGLLLHAVNTMPTTTAREIPASRLNPRIRILLSCFLWSFGFAADALHARRASVGRRRDDMASMSLVTGPSPVIAIPSGCVRVAVSDYLDLPLIATTCRDCNIPVTIRHALAILVVQSITSEARTGRWSDPVMGRTSPALDRDRSPHQDVVGLRHRPRRPCRPRTTSHRAGPTREHENQRWSPQVHVAGEHARYRRQWR